MVGQQVLHGETLHHMNEVSALGRKRLHAIGGGLASVMWSVVLIGAAFTISVTYLLQIQLTIHLVLTALFAMFIGLVVFVIARLDQPLTGPLAIGLPQPAGPQSTDGSAIARAFSDYRFRPELR